MDYKYINQLNSLVIFLPTSYARITFIWSTTILTSILFPLDYKTFPSKKETFVHFFPFEKEMV